jgi:CRISPR-associated endoribonuclease Cas6
MLRVRMRLPKGSHAVYRHLDLVHDALVNALAAAGALSDQVVGPEALPWNFGALGHHRGHEGIAHSLVVSTPSLTLAQALARIDPAAVRYARAATGEMFDFTEAELAPEPPPPLPEQAVLGVLTLSPMAISDPSKPGKHWHTRLDACDLSAAVNARLSRLAGRRVALRIQPDSLYLRANPRHSVLVSTKSGKAGRSAFVIGMEGPLVLAGHCEDLLFAWYAGIGEKTRNGFGCIGLVEEGVGR